MPSKIQVQEIDVKAERRRKTMRATFVSAGAIAVLGVAAGAAWYFTPPAMPETIEDAQALVESSKFARLTKQEKQPYLDVIREQFGSADPDTRRQLIRENEAMRDALRASRNAEREAFIKQYVLASPAERDELMQEMRERRAERGDRGERGNRGNGPSDERINDRATNGSAQNSQLFGEMRMQRRRANSGS
ncbi:MAG: hypothetical protein AAFX76_09825 [Planctomycetota bacterium]